MAASYGKAPRLKVTKEGLALKRELEALIRVSGGNRSAGLPGSARALEWLKAEAKKIPGWQVEEERFTPDVDFAIRGYRKDFQDKLGGMDPNLPEVKKWKKATDGLVAWAESLRGKKGINLILRKAGSDPAAAREVVVVGAHYDTITHDHATMEVRPEAPAPGADDNGAAVVTLLSIARRLSGLKPARAVELVFFDYEEPFFLGSKARAEALRKQDVNAFLINLEMIGWDKPRDGLVKIYARSAGHPGGEKDVLVGTKLGRNLNSRGLVANVLRNNFDRSDNWSFWNALHFGVTVSEDWELNFNEKHYHTASDTPDTLNWALVERIRDGVEATARELATARSAL